jgi:hypothetical protein
MKSKLFKAVAVSSNANSFGLHQHVLLAKDGQAFKALKTGQFKMKQGENIRLRLVDPTKPAELHNIQWGPAGFECPENCPNAPKAVVKEVWQVLK